MSRRQGVWKFQMTAVFSRIIFACIIMLPGMASAAELTSLEAGYRQMYDQQFERAHDSFRQWAGCAS